jgi:hypothetical protein
MTGDSGFELAARGVAEAPRPPDGPPPVVPRDGWLERELAVERERAEALFDALCRVRRMAAPTAGVDLLARDVHRAADQAIREDES